MLVLSRKAGEQLVIDGNIIITVNRVAGHRVSIGIEAPHDVQIARGELRGPDLSRSRLETLPAGV
ncbi:MAG TPA: carbon storage regulator [Pirellulales bacterium]|nr:carbon storage regulator [Pirellulales bacterium]